MLVAGKPYAGLRDYRQFLRFSFPDIQMLIRLHVS